jgi:type II secretory pathway component PulF
MMDCTSCRSRLTAALDRELAPEEKGPVDAHLATCAACRRLADELMSAGGELGRGLASLADQAPPPGDLLAGVQARMRITHPLPDAHETPRDADRPPPVRALPPSTGMFALQTGGEFLARFARTLSVLLNAGRPLPRALTILAASGEAGDHAAAVRQLAARVTEGHPLSEAMRAQEDVFPHYLAETVRAGEASGRLAQVLERAADMLEMRYEARQRIAASLSYPAVVLSVMALVVGFAMYSVLPKLVKIYASHNMKMPALTRMMGNIAHPVYSRPVLSITAAIALFMVARMLWRHPGFARAVGDLQLRIPVYRAIHAQYLVGWTSAVTSVLLDGGVPVARALALAAGASENRAYAGMVTDLQRRVEAGETLAAALDRSPAFPHDARQILSAGEEANCLEHSFRSVARLYHERLSGELKMLGALLEPAAVLLLGCVVAVFCLTIYAPIAHMGPMVSRY